MVCYGGWLQLCGLSQWPHVAQYVAQLGVLLPEDLLVSCIEIKCEFC